MKRLLLKAVAVLTLVLLIDWGMGLASEHIVTRLSDKLSQIGSIQQSLLHKEADVLVLGASCAKYHYNTQILQDSLQLTVQNSGVGGMKAVYSDLVLQAYLERCVPKWVVIDVYGQLDAGEGRLPRVRPFYGLSQPVTKYYDSETDWQQRLKLHSALYRYNGTADLLARHYFNAPNRTNGFSEMTGSMERLDTTVVSHFCPDSLQVSHLLNVIRLCREHHIRLALVLSPRSEHDTAQEQWFSRLCDEYGLLLINELHTPVYYAESGLFHDASHLNGRGAALFSSRIAHRLKLEDQTRALLLPYQDPMFTSDERAADLCARLTLEEKAALMMHESPAIERLGIPQFNWWNEALHGVGRNGTATVLPIPMGMAATWDDALVERAFTAVSDEARAKNNQARHEGTPGHYQCLSFWTPNINIFRDPRWGRGQETYGEDPFLTSRMGMAVVRGLQGERKGGYRKLLATAKHFAVHSGPEWSRHRMNIEALPERDLYETYLPAFKELVQEADVQEIMCAYQRLAGEPCCGNSRLLQQILRQEWGFDGIVVSDCWAVDDFFQPGRHDYSPSRTEATGQAVHSGTDLECGEAYRAIPDAVRAGMLTEAEVDTHLKRLLKARFELGDFDSEERVPWKRIPADVIASDAHRALALELARKSIVLLKNSPLPSAPKGVELLPLTTTRRIAVMGPNAADSTILWGNYNGFPVHTVTLLEGIHRFAPTARYIKGLALVTQPLDSIRMFVAEARDCDIVIYCGGLSPRVEGEELKVTQPGFKGGDRTSIELPQAQRDALRLLHEAGKRVIFVCCSGSAVALEPELTTCDAIVQAWYGGEAAGTALAEVLFGRVNPSGHLPVTFYRNDAQLPDYEDYRMNGRTYRYLKDAPLFPFGFGLSYTTFETGKPRWKDGRLQVSVTNTGRRSGETVVQAYIRRLDDVDGPSRTLRAFRRVALQAGESHTIELSLPRSCFETWDASTATMRVVPGKYEITVGLSSADGKSISVKI